MGPVHPSITDMGEQRTDTHQSMGPVHPSIIDMGIVYNVYFFGVVMIVN